MKAVKLLVAIALVFVIASCSGLPIRDSTLPCGFQKIANVCMTAAPDKDGERSVEFTFNYSDLEWLLIFSYLPREHVGFAIGSTDHTRGPVAVLYLIKENKYMAYDFRTGDSVEMTEDEACLIVGRTWDVLDALKVPIPSI